MAGAKAKPVRTTGTTRRVLLVDNYDSFTFNLYQYLSELGARVTVRRNDAVTVADVRRMKPDRIVISPGPGRPDDAGVSLALIEAFAPTIPLLGVCLGHQSLGQVFGGRVIKAPRMMHGKTSVIRHEGLGVFRGLESPFEVTRYHSLIVERETLPDCLQITSETDDGTIMGLRHREYPAEGVQFHPESILTSHGKQMLETFLR